jgi:enamine deaminase RidA (YjgF/YER057c/UK114 family)
LIPKAGGWLYISGQQGQTLENPSVMIGEVEAETRQALTNMGHILQVWHETKQALTNIGYILPACNRPYRRLQK